MTRLADVPDPVFVTAEVASQRCQVSRSTWDAWVQAGFVPQPCIDRGQVIRWHWPTVEKKLAGETAPVEHSPFVEAMRNARRARQERRGKKGGARAPA